jgi:hypothetical protein
MDLLSSLGTSSVPKLLVCGEENTFQVVEYPERFANQMPHTIFSSGSRFL